jgi:hypothetical protein
MEEAHQDDPEQRPSSERKWMMPVLACAAAAAIVIAVLAIRGNAVDERQLAQRATTEFVQHMSRSMWKQAADMGTADSQFTDVSGRRYSPAGVATFVKLITTAGTMQSMTANPHKIIQLNKKTYAFVGDLTLTVHTATGATVTLQWGIQLVWVRVGDTWKLQQIKELTPRRPVRPTPTR